MSESAPDLVGARSGEPGDVTATVALALAEANVIRDERGGRWHLDHDLDRTPVEVRHRAALGSDDALLAVGTIDGVVVGYALARLSAAIDGHLCMIDELVVDPRARAIGVGSCVLDHVRTWAVSEGCLALESQVLPGNRAAKNFFERVGMKTRKMRVSADLSQAASEV